MSISRTLDWLHAQNVPAYTSEEDIEARWQEHLRESA